MKSSSNKVSNAVSSSVAFAVPLHLEETMIEPRESISETDKRMLLFRLSDAASRIRDEANLIRRTAFTDASGRLLRILGETVEEQRLALGDAGGDKK